MGLSSMNCLYRNDETSPNREQHSVTSYLSHKISELSKGHTPHTFSLAQRQSKPSCKSSEIAVLEYQLDRAAIPVRSNRSPSGTNHGGNPRIQKGKRCKL